VKALTTVLDLLGSGLVVAGLAMLFLPAAVIFAGAGVLFVSWRLTR